MSLEADPFWMEGDATNGFDLGLEDLDFPDLDSMFVEQTPTFGESSSSGTRDHRPVRLACIRCRNKHLKCDGGVRCSRCRSDGLPCSYIKSRRGLRGSRRSDTSRVGRQFTGSTANEGPGVHDLPQGATDLISLTPSSSTAVPGSGDSEDASFFICSMAQINPQSPKSQPFPYTGDSIRVMAPRSETTIPSVSRNSSIDPDPDTAMIISAFFAFFYSSHPFLLPRMRLMELLSSQYLPHLHSAIQYIGSFFVAPTSTKCLEQSVDRLLFQSNPPKDGFLVQAMLLYTLGLHGNNNAEKASKTMQSAIDIALEIGMHHREFAADHASGCALMEESWRRTWWELYVVNGFLASVNQSVRFQLFDVPNTVVLPCEEDDFIAGRIPCHVTIEDYDNSAFSSKSMIYSSFTYRIDAVRILGQVLARSKADEFDYDVVDAVDTHLTNWYLYLPEKKKEILGQGKTVDEMLFQAHMIINGSSILLHRPRSNLSFKSAKDVKTCVSSGTCLLPSQPFEVHTRKAMQAADTIAHLSKLPVSLNKHTHFFACVVTMAAVVHLACWSSMPSEEVALLKVKLEVGVLRVLARVWPIANTVMQQVQRVGEELFALKISPARQVTGVSSGSIGTA